MSLKRKADQLSSSLPQAQVSAFAVASAAHNLETPAESSDTSSERSPGFDDNITDEEDPLFLRSEAQPTDYDNFSDQEIVVSGGVVPLTSFINIQLSSWSPNESNVSPGTDKAVSIRLKPYETVTIIGQFDICVKAGAILFYGAVLRKGRGTYRAFVPTTSALPFITCLPDTVADIEIWQCHRTLGSLGKISPLFRRIWNHPMERNPSNSIAKLLNKHSFSFLLNSRDDPHKRLLFPLEVPQAWDQTIQRLARPSMGRVPKILVCGPKGSGKSTFSRILANRLITSRPEATSLASQSLAEFQTICWLDLDPGQPEFSPPGQLSLVHLRKPIFGPPFTHPFTDRPTSYHLIRAHSIAAISPKEDPVYYLECANDLLTQYGTLQRSFPSCPLIINCPGWAVGSAMEIFSQLVKLSEITDIAFMGYQDCADIVKSLSKDVGSTPVHRLPAPVRQLLTTARTAPELRAMQNIAYFHQVGPTNGNLRWSSVPVNKQVPLVLSYSATGPDILGILTLGEQPDSAFLSTVLEGSLVAICIMEDDAEIGDAIPSIDRTASENLPYWPIGESGLSFKLAAKTSRTAGLALVQQIDATGQKLKLQTPISDLVRKQISRKTGSGNPRLLLVRGKFDTPGWAYLEDIYYSQQHRSGQNEVGDGPSRNTEDLGGIAAGLLGPSAPSDSRDDGELTDVPWVKKSVSGQSVGQRWRVRRDIGRPKRRNASSSASGRNSKSRAAGT